MIYISVSIATRGKLSGGSQGIATAGKFPYRWDLGRGKATRGRAEDYTRQNEAILMVIIKSVLSGALE